MEMLELETSTQWHDWLEANHDHCSEIWLIFYRKASGKQAINYQEALDEALCFGWVDSLIKKIDGTKYARKFTLRRDGSSWSLVNKERVQQLISQGKMTESGMAKVHAAQRSGSWDAPTQKPELDLSMPPEFASSLAHHPRAKGFYESLAPTYQKQFLAWIVTAKREATRIKRINASIEILSRGDKLGLK